MQKCLLSGPLLLKFVTSKLNGQDQWMEKKGGDGEEKVKLFLFSYLVQHLGPRW